MWLSLIHISMCIRDRGKTIATYEKAADAIAEFTADERTMTQYIIGAVSDLDVPMNPAAKGLYSLSAYMTGLDNATLQRERDELLAATEEDIRALSAHIRAFMQEDPVSYTHLDVYKRQRKMIIRFAISVTA